MKTLNKQNSKNDEKFHQTKLLLQIYRKVVWRLEEGVYDIDAVASELGGRSISELVNLLSFDIDEFDSTKDREAIEARLMSITESKNMIELIDKALMKLKTHPDKGEMYFNIITANYINKDVLSDKEIMNKVNLSSSTYYRYKNKAIETMSVILWGYILPSLKEVWSLVSRWLYE